MKKTSEWVSVGHPDKVCDYISSRLLDEYLKQDPQTRFAVEVQMKDNFITLGGELSSRAKITPTMRDAIVRKAVAEIGYTAEYADRWGKGNVPCADALEVVEHLSEQSPDIAQGVNAGGWGDQGIFWGMAVRNPDCEFFPKDWYLAKKIGTELYNLAVEGVVDLGIDIKTQVETDGREVVSVIVAAPCKPEDERVSRLQVTDIVSRICGKDMAGKIVFNGTGAYVRHGSVGDCGTTGRKLAVDFYGGNCRIGGGSPWTKDGTKADVALNVYAREIAHRRLFDHPEADEIHCAIACCIGRPEITVTLFDERMREIDSWSENKDPTVIIDGLGLRKPCFAHKCVNGLFSRPKGV